MGKNIALLQKKKAAEEKKALESFYRNYFWKRMLHGRELGIFLPPVSSAEERFDPRLFAGKRIVDAASELSHYLSNRRIRGNIQFMMLDPDSLQMDGQNRNFISIGNVRTERDHSCGSDGRKPLAYRGFVSLHEVQTVYTSTQLAQMILLRSVPSDPGKNVNFEVSLAGTSEAATLALTSVLINDDRKRHILHTKSEEDGQGMLPLHSIQEKVRGVFLDRFYAQLEEDLAFLDKEERRQMRCVSGMYLSTLLYQHFLPFLTRDDEASICIGLEACLTAMSTTDDGDFSWMARTANGKSMVQTVVAALGKQLASFHGIEVLYRVNTRSETIGHDIVEKQELREPDQPDIPFVSCLFV